MKAFKKSIYIIPLIFFFASCEKVIQFNGPVTDPIVVVNSFVTPDSVVVAEVSLSRFFLSSDATFDMVNNATVSLLVNGIQKENLKFTSNGLYVGTYHPAVGDSISLLVQTPGKNNVSCSAVIEPQVSMIFPPDTTSVITGASSPIVVVNKTTGVQDTIGNSFEKTLKFVLKFNDDSNVQNYYRLVVFTKTVTPYGAFSDYTFSFDDIVSGNANNTVGPPTSLTSNKYNVFSDDLFNGKQYPLTFSVQNNANVYYPGKSVPGTQKEVYINLQSISKSYYLYLQTRASIKSNTFFAEPVQVYNNVDGGIGILGSYTSNVRKLTLQ